MGEFQVPVDGAIMNIDQ